MPAEELGDSIAGALAELRQAAGLIDPGAGEEPELEDRSEGLAEVTYQPDEGFDVSPAAGNGGSDTSYDPADFQPVAWGQLQPPEESVAEGLLDEADLDALLAASPAVDEPELEDWALALLQAVQSSPSTADVVDEAGGQAWDWDEEASLDEFAGADGHEAPDWSAPPGDEVGPEGAGEVMDFPVWDEASENDADLAPELGASTGFSDEAIGVSLEASQIDAESRPVEAQPVAPTVAAVTEAPGADLETSADINRESPGANGELPPARSGASDHSGAPRLFLPTLVAGGAQSAIEGSQEVAPRSPEPALARELSQLAQGWSPPKLTVQSGVRKVPGLHGLADAVYRPVELLVGTIIAVLEGIAGAIAGAARRIAAAAGAVVAGLAAGGRAGQSAAAAILLAPLRIVARMDMVGLIVGLFTLTGLFVAVSLALR